MSIFYEKPHVPVHSVVLLHSRQEAIDFPSGQIVLGFCRGCGFISNVSYDPSLHDYSLNYESTQSCSEIFDTFAHRVAQDLVNRYDLFGKTILEIGCGQGEFLRLLCDLGRNWGIGFDPAYVEGNSEAAAHNRITFVKDYYSEKYADQKGDIVVCKMTLEHIQKTSDFVGMVRRSLGDRLDTIVFFQVPDVTRILRELAFWDIYYEHCSYFGLVSLSRLFRDSGFEILRVSREYGDQYLLLEARPKPEATPKEQVSQFNLQALKRDVAYFSTYSKRRIKEWQQSIGEQRLQGMRHVVWGGGSKAVAFLTTLGIEEEIEFIVDINPKKDGTYIAGTGQRIVTPAFLSEYKPDVVIVMNPIYIPEIAEDLEKMGISAKLISV